jgi:hypothetical protein
LAGRQEAVTVTSACPEIHATQAGPDWQKRGNGKSAWHTIQIQGSQMAELRPDPRYGQMFFTVTQHGGTLHGP